jgi:hypothetical protein
MKPKEQEKKLEFWETIKEFDLDEIRAEAKKQALSKHRWVQKGIWLECKSCKFRHGFYIGINKIMVGVDEVGNPILKDKKEVFKK